MLDNQIHNAPIDIELDKLDTIGNLWELGHEMSDQLHFELNCTHWELQDISCQVRELNQLSIELIELEEELIQSLN